MPKEEKGKKIHKPRYKRHFLRKRIEKQDPEGNDHMDLAIRKKLKS